jgi:hypothetical protein
MNRLSQRVGHLFKCSSSSSRACAIARATPRTAITVVVPNSSTHLLALRSSHPSISPRLYRRSYPRLLLRPSRNSPEQLPPAAAAAGLQRARPPALFSPWVSTQTGPVRLLEPSQPLPRPRPPARSPDFGRPRRPHGPRAALRGLNSF